MPGPFNRNYIGELLAAHGYTSNPEGLVATFPVDYVHEEDGLAYLDINADAVRKGDEVPDRPIRITFQKLFDGVSTRWTVQSVEELAEGVDSGAMNRLNDTPRISPWHFKGGTPIELTVTYGAHHEAGHIVIAAVQGLRLRPDGLMVAATGEGLSVYSTQPEESDDSKVRVLLSTFAGYWAAERFCVKHACPELLDPRAVLSPDWIEARKIIVKLSNEYLAGENVMTVQLRLESESKRLVEQHWSVIEALAVALCAKNPEPMRPLKDGTVWLNHNCSVRYMAGEEAVGILAAHGITAVCKSRLDSEQPDNRNPLATNHSYSSNAQDHE